MAKFEFSGTVVVRNIRVPAELCKSACICNGEFLSQVGKRNIYRGDRCYLGQQIK